MAQTPVWTWLPDTAEPVLAGTLISGAGHGRFVYAPDYLERPLALPLDPVELRLNRSARGIALLGGDGLPGVLRDAKPAGYGEDRLRARHGGDELGALDLLELGVPDGVGAVEACHDLGRKLAWRPKRLHDLQGLAEDLEVHEPSSRALRRLNDDLDTSAGGDRPKATLKHEGRLWLVKMQARGDRPALPAREFVTMTLAGQVGVHAAPVRLHTFGAHQVLMVERFDRTGDPDQPTRKLYASAHTALRLRMDSVRGDPERSYLNLADKLRTWVRVGPAGLQGRIGDELAELWRRIAFNALVGNTDDHHLNTGFLCSGVADGKPVWGLSPAFDITPNSTTAFPDGPPLAMATGVDGLSGTSLPRLIEAGVRLGLDPADATAWLANAASAVAEAWERLLRESARPVMPDQEAEDRLISSTRPSFAYAEQLAMRLR